MSRVQRAATLATMPRWQRRMAGLRQSRLVDALIVPVMRIAFRAGALSTRLQLRILALGSPSTVPVVEPVFREVPPLREETLTPSEAFERHRVPTPAEIHAELRGDVAAAA